jgi:hypothetical protein
MKSISLPLPRAGSVHWEAKKFHRKDAKKSATFLF